MRNQFVKCISPDILHKMAGADVIVRLGTTRYWNSEAFLAYYDKRLCKPEHNDQEIFTQLCLEIFAAGLSLVTILEKEANLRKTFDNFDPNIIINYDAEKICELMVDDLKKWKQ